MGSTYDCARRMGAGVVLRSLDGTKYTVSDWDNITGQVYGRGPLGNYGLLPDDLMPLVAYRMYKCGRCGAEKKIQTNHIDAVPAERCAGTCRNILRPHTAREKVLPYYGPHWYFGEVEEGEK